MRTIDEIKKEFPLHWYVWKNDVNALQTILNEPNVEKEKIDPRGRTPLMLAVKLSHLKCVKLLLAAKCSTTYELDGWSIVQEAVCSANEEILTAIIEVRDLQRHVQRATHVPKLLDLLLDAPDFYIEMKWEFTSWVPLMSRLCPSDTYKVYKRGSTVRIDTTLLGFDSNTWVRGNRTYIFKGSKDSATLIEIDHDNHEVMTEEMSSNVGNIVAIPPPIGAVRARLEAPVITNSIEVKNISFERNKTGIWGWRSDKSEEINGYLCKVYSASNVEFTTQTRMEHLNENQIKNKSSKSAFHNFLRLADEDYISPTDTPVPHKEDKDSLLKSKENEKCEGNEDEEGEKEHVSSVAHNISPEEYFSNFDLKDRVIGRPKVLNKKVQRFKANLWLSENFPMSLQEQVLPILDLMSTLASPHVKKLKDFITMQLPSGYPVKIEIPLFHVLNGCITFGNVFGMTNSVPHVTTINEGNRIACIIDEQCFNIPTFYTRKGTSERRLLSSMDEEEILQYAIEQSLADTKEKSTAAIDNMESDKVDIWEALRGEAVIGNAGKPCEAFRRPSMNEWIGGATFSEQNKDSFAIDPDLALALRLSQQERERHEYQMKEEIEMIEQALKLSLNEN